LVLGVLAAVAATGLGRLAPDAEAIYELPAEHPVAQATELLNEVTAGDDVVVVVMSQTSDAAQGVLRPEGLQILEAVQASLESMPELVEVRSVLNAPVLTEKQGALTATTPLRPPPDSIAAWSEARNAVSSDRFIQASLLSEDARTTAVIGWLWSGTPDQWVARRATFALRDESFRDTAVGASIQDAVNDARMAVALGDSDGPVEVAITAQLTLLAAEEIAVSDLLSLWRAAPGTRTAPSVASRLTSVVGELAAPAKAGGFRLAQVGEQAVQQEVEELYPPSLARALGLAAILAGFINFGLRRSLAPALLAAGSVPISSALLLGLLGFLGGGLHPVSIACAFLVGWWALAFGTARGEGAGDDPLGMALWAVPLGAGTMSVVGYGSGGGPAAAATVLVAVLVAVACFTPREQVDLPPNRLDGRTGALAAVALGLVSFLLWNAGVGLDPSRVLADSEDAGWASQTLSSELGTLPSAFLVHDFRDGDARALTDPEVLQSIALGEQVAADPQTGVAQGAVRSVVGWVDYLQAVAAGMGDPQVLSGERATVEQYLLMFHRPEDTRALVSSDLAVGVSILALDPGAGPRLAAAAGSLSGPSPRPQLAGRAVEMMLAARGAVQRGFTGMAALLVLFLGLGGSRGQPIRTRLAQGVAVGVSLGAGLAAGVAVEGVVTSTALLGSLAAGGLLAASWSWGDRAALTSLGLGGTSACGLLLSPILGLRGLGLVLLVACLAAWILRAKLVWGRAQPESGGTS